MSRACLASGKTSTPPRQAGKGEVFDNCRSLERNQETFLQGHCCSTSPWTLSSSQDPTMLFTITQDTKELLLIITRRASSGKTLFSSTRGICLNKRSRLSLDFPNISFMSGLIRDSWILPGASAFDVTTRTGGRKERKKLESHTQGVEKERKIIFFETTPKT